MFKNKTEQRRNVGKYNNTGITVKIHINHMTYIWCQSDCDHAEVHRGYIIMAISWHRCKTSLKNYNSRPSSEQLRAYSGILCDALSGRPRQSLKPSFTALLSRVIFMFLWIRLSFIHKTRPWVFCYLLAMRKNSRVAVSFHSTGF